MNDAKNNTELKDKLNAIRTMHSNIDLLYPLRRPTIISVAKIMTAQTNKEYAQCEGSLVNKFKS